ncbi:HAMP domain-containing histidine kinase [Candidatus Nomurabacteria bacterium]|nr:HAMP domain-containing histidine kinase [Candidatus Nomurabacteria bacterium]
MTNHNRSTQSQLKELEEAQKQQQEFISMIVHELRTPLSGTKWTLKMLLDGDLAHFSEEQLHILREGYRSNERMVDLLEELSRANKAQVWTFQYTFEESDVEELIEETMTQFLSAARARNLTIKFQRPKSTVPHIRIDKNKMTIVLEHMIENAIKYTPEGEMISVALELTDKYIVVRVHNPGTTLGPGDHEIIFEKYTRGSLARTSQTPGTGMGLFTVRKIVEDHQGVVAFTSTSKEGTTITIQLPLEK